MIAAMVTRKGGATGNPVMFPLYIALVAHRPSIRPTSFLYVLQTCVIRWKLCIELGNRVFLFWGDRVGFLVFHSIFKYCAYSTCRQGIIARRSCSYSFSKRKWMT